MREKTERWTKLVICAVGALLSLGWPAAGRAQTQTPAVPASEAAPDASKPEAVYRKTRVYSFPDDEISSVCLNPTDESLTKHLRPRPLIRLRADFLRELIASADWQ